MSSRPSSRASTTSASIRPPSSLSSYSTLTPSVKSSKQASRQFGGIDQKHAEKINKAVASSASARKGSRRPPDDISEESDADETMVRDKGKARAMPTGAFAERSSFAHAPLVSRVVAASPHRKLALAKSTDRPPKQPRFLDALEAPDDDDAARDETAEFEEVYQKQKEPIPEDLHLQEALVIEDLLHVLMGIEGQFIEYEKDFAPEDEVDRLNGAGFIVDNSLDHSLQVLATRIVPLATHYMAIDAYVEKHCRLDFGLVNHALSAALRDILRTYLDLLAKLEYQFNHSPTFTLQRLWFFVQPMIKKFAILYELVTELSANPKDLEEDADTDYLSDEDDLAQPEAIREAIAQLKGKSKAPAGPVRGGEVLAVLEARKMQDSGDPIAKELFSMLFLRASQPYATMVLDWITTGRLRDPEDEFIVHENKSQAKDRLSDDYIDQYWEARYTLKDAALGGRIVSLEVARERGHFGGAIIPHCLHKHRDKILLAGKYLNVIRECGIEIEADAVGLTTSVEIDQPSFYARIDSAYAYANQTLLKLLIEDQHFLDRLRSLKHYFFIDCGDAFTSFLDQAAQDLARPVKQISLSKLQSLLDIALRNPSSASSSDPYKEDVRAATSQVALFDFLVNINSVEGTTMDRKLSNSSTSVSASAAEHKSSSTREISGYDAFVIDYKISFPLALIFSRKTILYYQHIFRFLLQVRHAEDELTSVWLEHAKAPVWRSAAPSDFRHPAIERWKARAFALRMHMLSFLQQLYSYAVAEVLEPRWRELVKKLDKIKTVDELLRCHLDFLNTAMKELLMINNEALSLVSKLLASCHMLKSYHDIFTKGLAKALKQLEDANGDHSRVDFSQQEVTLHKFERHFYHHLRSLWKHTQYLSTTDTTAFIALHSRLDSLRTPDVMKS